MEHIPGSLADRLAQIDRKVDELPAVLRWWLRRRMRRVRHKVDRERDQRIRAYFRS